MPGDSPQPPPPVPPLPGRRLLEDAPHLALVRLQETERLAAPAVPDPRPRSAHGRRRPARSRRRDRAERPDHRERAVSASPHLGSRAPHSCTGPFAEQGWKSHARGRRRHPPCGARAPREARGGTRSGRGRENRKGHNPLPPPPGARRGAEAGGSPYQPGPQRPAERGAPLVQEGARQLPPLGSAQGQALRTEGRAAARGALSRASSFHRGVLPPRAHLRIGISGGGGGLRLRRLKCLA